MSYILQDVLEAKIEELEKENARLREALEKIATYRQFPSEKIALNALYPNEDITDE